MTASDRLGELRNTAGNNNNGDASLRPAESASSISALLPHNGESQVSLATNDSELPKAGSALELELEKKHASNVDESEPVDEFSYPDGWHARNGFSETVFAGAKYVQDSLVFYRDNKLRLKNEILSGLTVAIAQVPESVAFSFVAGVDPLVGLYATFFLGLITAQIGGRPGMVSGAAGAMAVVAKIVMEPGGLFPEDTLIKRGEIKSCLGCDSLRQQAYDKRREYLFLVMWIVGILQILVGVLKMGSLVKLIPTTVMIGFVNGLAIIIFSAQLESFMEMDWGKGYSHFLPSSAPANYEINSADVTRVFAKDLPDLTASQLATEIGKIMNETDTNNDGLISLSEFGHSKDHAIHDGHDEFKKWRVLSEASTWLMLFYVFGSMFVVHYLPRLTKVVPSSLVSICCCLIFEHAITRPAMGLETPTVRDMSPVKGGLPTFKVPDVDFDNEALSIIMPTCISLCAVGLIESILTLQLVDEILDDTSDSTGRCTQECVAQGIANLMSAMFQSMGGDAMIGQSTINVKSGGIGRLSTTFASVMFLIFIVAASSVIELVPIAALTGVLFMVVIYTFDWTSLTLMVGDLREALSSKASPKMRCRWQDSLLIILVTGVTVATNLAIAVVLGVIVAALFYAWENSTSLSCRTYIGSAGEKVYEFAGPLYFASDRGFKCNFLIAKDPAEVVADLTRVQIKDYSGLAALNSLGGRYTDMEKKLTVRLTRRDNAFIIDLLGKRLENVVLDWVDDGEGASL
ncbi:sulfate permease [Pycnococcus provasolii]